MKNGHINYLHWAAFLTIPAYMIDGCFGIILVWCVFGGMAAYSYYMYNNSSGRIKEKMDAGNYIPKPYKSKNRGDSEDGYTFDDYSDYLRFRAVIDVLSTRRGIGAKDEKWHVTVARIRGALHNLYKDESYYAKATHPKTEYGLKEIKEGEDDEPGLYLVRIDFTEDYIAENLTGYFCKREITDKWMIIGKNR